MKRFINLLILQILTFVSFSQNRTTSGDAIRKEITPKFVNGVIKQFTISQLKAQSISNGDSTTLYYVTDTGKKGYFELDKNDNSSTGNDSTIVVTNNGKRLKRTIEQYLAPSTTGKYYRGDKTWQVITKSDIPTLSNVDNTSDLNKPISTATQTALLGKLDKGYSISELRGLSNSILAATQMFYCSEAGKEGFWKYDASDNSSSDNLGTILITGGGKRLKRVFQDYVFVEWFGAIGDGSNNDTQFILNAISFAKNSNNHIALKKKTYVCDYFPLYTSVNIDGGKCKIKASNASSVNFVYLADYVVQNIKIKDITFEGNLSVSNQNGISAIAVADPLSTSHTGGLWNSVFENVTCQYFTKNQWQFIADDNDTYPSNDLANQFLILTNCYGYHNNGTSSKALYIKGQFGQVQFIGGGFDMMSGISGFALGTNNVKIDGIISTSNDYAYQINFLNTTFQNCETAIIIDISEVGINFNSCYFENLTRSIQINNSSFANVRDCRFGNAGSASLTTGFASNGGSIIENNASYVNFSGNNILGARDKIFSGNTTYMSNANLNFVDNNGFSSSNITKQIGINSNSINTYAVRSILLNSENKQLDNISCLIAAGETIFFKTLGSVDTYTKVTSSGNITLPNNQSSIYIRGGQSFSISKIDLGGNLVLQYSPQKTYFSSVPTSGTWNTGEIVYNSTNTGTYAWVCTNSGSPGTWKSVIVIDDKGTISLASGLATISNSAIKTTSSLWITTKTLSGTSAHDYTYNISTDGTATVTARQGNGSTETGCNSTIQYLIIN